jgi:3-oxoacyl-[acyl-carrier-protein] synthase I
MNLAIHARGLCTPLGLSARVTAAEMAAGTAVFAETAVRDRVGLKVRAAALPLIPSAASRLERMSQLAKAALHDLLSRLSPAPSGEQAALLLVEPEPGDLGEPLTLGGLAAELMDMLRAARISVEPRHFALGRAGLFAAVQEAERFLHTHPSSSVIVGAFDSLCDAASLSALARSNQVLGDANPDGLMPSEGAGFILLRRSSGAPGLSELRACATARGPAGPAAAPEEAGRALTEVFRQLAAPQRPARVLSAQTSARWSSLELRMAMIRAPKALPEPFALTRISETLGDPGAVASLVLTVAAVEWLAAGAPGPFLVYGSSDGGLAGGLVVSRP